MKKRHFTRQQIEARCLEIHPDNTEETVTRIKDVRLLLDAPFTLWRMEYEKITFEGKSYEMRTTLVDIYHEEQLGDKLILLPFTEKSIPAGCATVEEEDAAMREVKV